MHSKFPIPVFTKAQEQDFIKIYKASEFLLNQANYKPDFENLNHLENWPLFLLVTNLIILLNAKASDQLFIDSNLDLSNIVNKSEFPENIQNDLKEIWGNFDICSFLVTKMYYEYIKDPVAYRLKYDKMMKLYNIIKSETE
jgi:hypothetical protein